MEVRIEHLEALFNAISEEANQSLDHYGFGIISSLIENKTSKQVSKKYLYETYNALGKARETKQETIGLNPAKLNELTSFIGFNSFQEFVEAFNSPASAQLKSLLGNYYSYVRRNLGKGMLYRSPVRVYENNGRIVVELKGGRLLYSAVAKLRLGCLFIPFEASEEGKGFYHIYKIGNAEKPLVLQGTFSGISNGHDPIAGRAVLIRKNDEYEKLKNEELHIDDLKKSESLEERRLAEYFEDFTKNNLSVEKSYSFRIDDLGTCY